jgi:phosphopantetheinyl transferase (holo-ACP synthase)
VSVLRAASGAPRLEGPGAADLHVAITHGRRTAAAIATRRDARWPSVGIDLVDAEDAARLERIADRVLKPCERALLARDPAVLLLAWGAREAIAKATRTGMFLFALSRAWVVEIDLDARRIAVNVPGMDLGFAPLEDGGVLVFAGAGPEALAHAVAHATGPLDPVV